MSWYVVSNRPASRFCYPCFRLPQQANSDSTEVCLGECVESVQHPVISRKKDNISLP